MCFVPSRHFDGQDGFYRTTLRLRLVRVPQMGNRSLASVRLQNRRKWA